MRVRFSAQAGFTLIESMVATLLLAVGVLATTTLVNHGNTETAKTAIRESGNNLAREVVERARSLTYASLQPDANGRPTALTSLPGLTTSGGTGTWTISDRRGVFNVRADMCKIDDRSDGVGGRNTTFCDLTGGNGPGTGQPGSSASQIYGDLAALGLNVSVDISGGAANTMCNLLGANPSLDSTLGGAATLIGAGADMQVCASAGGNQGTIDRNPDDLTQLRVAVTSARHQETVVQATIIPNPEASAEV